MERHEPLADLDDRAALLRKRIRSSAAGSAFDAALGSIDRQAYRAIQNRHREACHSPDPPQYYKYLDVAFWLRAHALYAESIGLLSGPPRRVLDIGSGGGSFLAVCKAYGHDTLGFDVSNQLYTGLFDLFGIRRIEGGVFFGQPLPPEIGRHDEIIATGVVFDYHLSPEGDRRWLLPEWAGFLEYLTANHLMFPGALHLHVNRGDNRQGGLAPGMERGSFYTPLFTMLEKAGAAVVHDRGRASLRLGAPLKIQTVTSVWR